MKTKPSGFSFSREGHAHSLGDIINSCGSMKQAEAGWSRLKQAGIQCF